MAQRVSWCGTDDELLQLTAAVGHNCACANNSSTPARPSCPAHRMLWQDQRALNGLLFARHIVDRLLREEFSVSTPTSDAECAFTANMMPNRGGRGEHCCMSMLPGVALLVLGLGLLCAEDLWFVLGEKRECWIQPVGWQCIGWADPNLLLGWAIIGLLVMLCGTSLLGMAFFSRRTMSPSRPDSTQPCCSLQRQITPRGNRA
jgi:hypothetical protein